MATGDPVDETKVNDRGMVTIPADVRQRLDIAAGDKLRWRIDEDGDLTVEVIHQREGVFDNLDPVDVGETNAVEAEHEFGSE
jgi:antitoxin PrlF